MVHRSQKQQIPIARFHFIYFEQAVVQITASSSALFPDLAVRKQCYITTRPLLDCSVDRL